MKGKDSKPEETTRKERKKREKRKIKGKESN